MIIETPNFLELDYIHLSRILASSGLLITSELEVVNAANVWLNHNTEEREGFAKDVLLKVRFSLLSDDAIRQLLRESPTLSENDKCVKLLNEFLDGKNNCFPNKSSVYYTNRYCNQKLFNTLVCGGHDHLLRKPVRNVNRFHLTNFNTLSLNTQKFNTPKLYTLKVPPSML